MANKILKYGTTSNVDVVGLDDGSVISVDWVQAKIFQGKGFHAYVGSASTPATLDASYAATDPDISLDIPDGRMIIPIQITVVMEDFGTEALFETHTLCSKTLCASSAGTVFNPINMRTRTGGGSACSCYTGPTVTDGHTTGAFEINRHTLHAVADVLTSDDDASAELLRREFTWSYGQAGWAPLLEGDASIATWATSQAAKGIIQYWWLEFAEGEI